MLDYIRLGGTYLLTVMTFNRRQNSEPPDFEAISHSLGE